MLKMVHNSFYDSSISITSTALVSIELKELGKAVNVVLNIFVCYKLSVCWIFIVIAFFWMSANTYGGQAMSIGVYVSVLIWICANVSDVLTVVYHFVAFNEEAKKTVQLMEDLEKAVGKSNLPYKQVELFSLQVYVEDFKFSVFGCFPLDWTLLHSMVAGVATYLVIFHQFSNMEKNG
ncbi:hypothetical protein FQR65_LT19102 [Abscondita terminalis]|nr:hypothetical protein FQR65_LT19102 [Abscondita terminalis]